MNFVRSLPGLLAAAGLTTACGSLDGHSDRPSTLATVHGSLSIPASFQVAGALRVAVVWLQSDGRPSVSEDLPVQPVSLASFALDLRSPPPAGAIVHPSASPDSFGAAYGAVIAYEDRNGNGALDLVGDDAGSFVDRVVATNPEMALVYLQGPVPNLDGAAHPPHGAFQLGYSWLVPDCPDPDAGPPDGGDCDWDTFVDVATPFALTASADPLVNQIMCRAYGQNGVGSKTVGGWNVNPQGTPPGGYPVPGASGLDCINSGSPEASYDLSHCETVRDGLCEWQTNCSDLLVQLAGAPIPGGWPCPTTPIDAGTKGSP